ncbi:acyltransferase [Marinomonas transparens]|uniref:Acyltransferase n=1 Tax=Marinomonas transparens TaxID=2795388 RepID=A0A934N0F2_9GAMM|nr:acyltransferase [Marinomonas transparens]MBJ7538510.1 acyltransferase [Marinomonas transparens]
MSFLPVLRGSLSLSLIIFNTLLCFIPIVFLVLIKCVLPFAVIQAALSRILDCIATTWISINNINQNWLGRSILNVSGNQSLLHKEWYMITANHQSWVDILILQRVFNHKVPFIKFFLKQELIWVPVIGLVWWALDFPFMKRYSQAFLKKHPELKGKDIEVTKKACEKFQHFPVSIMNFLEGTRYTQVKYEQQASPFKYLLKPKAGGLAFALNAMGGKLHQLIDVTIVYPNGIPSFFGYLSGKVPEVKVHFRSMAIEDKLLGDYVNDPIYRAYFQQWVNELWQEKDHRIELMQVIEAAE